MSAHAHSFPPPADGVGQPDQDIPDGVVDGPFTRVVARFADGSEPVGASPGTTAPSDEILAIVAHELCNPLTPLQFAARALRLASVKRPEVSNMIDVIDRQIAQIARLAEDLTDATRVSRGELRLRKARVVLADVLSDFLDAAAVAGGAGRPPKTRENTEKRGGGGGGPKRPPPGGVCGFFYCRGFLGFWCCFFSFWGPRGGPPRAARHSPFRFLTGCCVWRATRCASGRLSTTWCATP